MRPPGASPADSPANRAVALVVHGDRLVALGADGRAYIYRDRNPSAGGLIWEPLPDLPATTEHSAVDDGETRYCFFCDASGEDLKLTPCRSGR